MKKCPFFKKECIKEQCMFWIHLVGKNPQTGEAVDDFGCAITALPLLLIENAKNVAQTQASVESFRNKSVEFQEILISALRASQQQKTTPEQKSSALIVDAEEEQELQE